jgi:hypothetical protein
MLDSVIEIRTGSTSTIDVSVTDVISSSGVSLMTSNGVEGDEFNSPDEHEIRTKLTSMQVRIGR